MNVPDDLKYAESHEWIRLDGDTGTVGITDHAQNELTDIVYVDPPKVGDTVTAGQPAAVVESVKAASDIITPVSGEVVEINEDLEATPSTVNTDPTGDGWMFKVKLSDPGEIDGLMDEAAYKAHCESLDG